MVLAETSVNDAVKKAKPFETVYIKNGVYKEKIVIDKPVKLIGEDREKTILTFDDGAFRDDMGTFKTASVHILGSADGFSAENITFENSAGMGDVVGQAVALYLDCDKAVIKNCILKGRQDTLLTAPMHEDIAREPKKLNRQYFENCYIEGDVDFIFGGATAVFKDCEIFSLTRGKEVNGYITAACTSKELKYGYVFIDCKLNSDCEPSTVYLGRPWREYAKTVFINCELGKHIKPEGFSEWNRTERHKTCYYAQYNSYGEGYDEKSVVKWSEILDNADEYTIKNIFGDWKPNDEIQG
jgi:pectinesterase